MKITRLEKGEWDWRINIKNFEKNDFERMILVIKDLGYSRDPFGEKKFGKNSIKGYSNLVKKEHRIFIAQWKILKQYIYMTFSPIRSRVYINRGNEINFSYNSSREFISINLTGKKLNGKKFVGLLK